MEGTRSESGHERGLTVSGEVEGEDRKLVADATMNLKTVLHTPPDGEEGAPRANKNKARGSADGTEQVAKPEVNVRKGKTMAEAWSQKLHSDILAGTKTSQALKDCKITGQEGLLNAIQENLGELRKFEQEVVEVMSMAAEVQEEHLRTIGDDARPRKQTEAERSNPNRNKSSRSDPHSPLLPPPYPTVHLSIIHTSVSRRPTIRQRKLNLAAAKQQIQVATRMDLTFIGHPNGVNTTMFGVSLAVGPYGSTAIAHSAHKAHNNKCSTRLVAGIFYLLLKFRALQLQNRWGFMGLDPEGPIKFGSCLSHIKY